MRDEQIVLLFFFLAALTIVLVALYYRFRKQQLLHQERMAALEKGLPIPRQQSPAPWSPRVYLLRGLMWSFAGLAICISLWGIAVSTQGPPSVDTVLWRAKSLAQNTGVSIEEAKKMIEKDSSRQGMPQGVALLGLIPLGVGLAYLVFYYTGGKELVGVQPPSRES